MPAPRGQNNTSLYAIIALTVLFLIAAVAAVTFYIKAEDFRTQARTDRQTLNNWVSPSERSDWVALVGDEISGRTNVGALLYYSNELTRMALGREPAQESVEARLLNLRTRFQSLLDQIGEDIDDFADATADETGMLAAIEQMARKTASAIGAQNAALAKINDLSAEVEMLRNELVEQEKEFAAKAEHVTVAAQTAQDSFDSLQEQMDQSLDIQVGMVNQRLAAAEETVSSLREELQQTKNELELSRERLAIAQDKLDKIVPPPDREIAAFRPDGSIVSVDNQEGLAYINLGSRHKVYRGLTFTVYDKDIPIPRDGQGKAQIEVIEVRDNISIGRISGASPRNPVIVDDTIANLVWNAEKTNVFVVAGDFDFNNDGFPDPDGAGRVAALITNWGGAVAEKVTPTTDFVVLGMQPSPPMRTADFSGSSANVRYQAAMDAVERYEEVLRQAEKFHIPIFNLERFLLFTGYESLSPRGSGTRL